MTYYSTVKVILRKKRKEYGGSDRQTDRQEKKRMRGEGERLFYHKAQHKG